VTGYALDGQDIGVRIPVRAKFSPLYAVQTGSDLHQASYLMCTGRSFLGGVKRPAQEIDHSLPSTAWSSIHLYIRSSNDLRGVVLN
jgi:hypothetical protein